MTSTQGFNGQGDGKETGSGKDAPIFLPAPLPVEALDFRACAGLSEQRVGSVNFPKRDCFTFK